jgi:hypothetical protein
MDLSRKEDRVENEPARGHEDQVLEDVLPFGGRGEGSDGEGQLREYEQWGEGAHHVQDEQDERRLHGDVKEKGGADGAFEEGEHEKCVPRINKAEGQAHQGLPGEELSGAQIREEL